MSDRDKVACMYIAIIAVFVAVMFGGNELCLRGEIASFKRDNCVIAGHTLSESFYRAKRGYVRDEYVYLRCDSGMKRLTNEPRAVLERLQ